MSQQFTTCKDFEQCGFAQEEPGYADDVTWVLTSSFVILTMQSGFGLLEMGSSMPGNEVHIMVKNVVDVVFGAVAYWLVGFGISFGFPSNPFMGLGDFVPTASHTPTDSGLKFSQYIFQFSFAATATTIVSGCIAMRGRFLVYCIYSFYAVIIYSFVAHWVWADDGWLKTLGYYDFAGGGPVHLFGGVNGAVAAILTGPRSGFFDGKRPRAVFRPVSPASQLFGLFMLWWGWIGFNCGSTFGITGTKWEVATRAAIVTINTTAGGGVMALLYSLARSRGKTIEVHKLVNGILGSLVTTSPACSVINTYEAFITGAIGALVAIYVNKAVKGFKVDDPVGAIGVHAGGAIWGILSVGLFADSMLPGIKVRDGLFRGGGFTLLGYQCIGIAAIIGWSLVCCIPFFYLLGAAISKSWKHPRRGLRVSLVEELEGADKFLHDVEELNVYQESNEFDELRTSERMEHQSSSRVTTSSNGGEGINDQDMNEILHSAELFSTNQNQTQDVEQASRIRGRGTTHQEPRRTTVLGMPHRNKC